MIQIPNKYKRDIPFNEACELVIKGVEGQNLLLDCMEAIRMRRDSYTLSWHTEKDIVTYNAYNAVFAKMKELF